MVQEVHDEALDVGAVVVLVRHDHQVPVAQLLRAVVHLRTAHILILRMRAWGRSNVHMPQVHHFDDWTADGDRMKSFYSASRVVLRELTLPCCRPRICLMALISALPLICVTLASLTFSSLPLRSHR